MHAKEFSHNIVQANYCCNLLVLNICLFDAIEFTTYFLSVDTWALEYDCVHWDKEPVYSNVEYLLR